MLALSPHGMGSRGSRYKGVERDDLGAVQRCIFCSIVAGEPVGGTRVLLETDRVVVFQPLAPGAAHHMLAVPKVHIDNANSLSAADAELLEELREAGVRALRVVREVPEEELQGAHFAFHVPPFNSIDHLHLHCMIPPYTSLWARIKYTPGTIWTHTLERVLARL